MKRRALFLLIVIVGKWGQLYFPAKMGAVSIFPTFFSQGKIETAPFLTAALAPLLTSRNPQSVTGLAPSSSVQNQTQGDLALEGVRQNQKGDLRLVEEWIALFHLPPSALKGWLEKNYGNDPDLIEERRQAYLDVLKAFQREYGNKPVVIAKSPARINLRGMHAEHRGAAPNYLTHRTETLVVAAPRDDDVVKLANLDQGFVKESFSLIREMGRGDWAGNWKAYRASPDVRDAVELSKGNWKNYCIGGVLAAHHHFAQRGEPFKRKGMEVMVGSNIPVSAGLSSSHAVVLGMALATLGLNGRSMDPRELVLSVQNGEWLTGARSGLGDQGAMIFGRPGSFVHSKFITLDEMRPEYIPFPEGYKVLIVNSGLDAPIVTTDKPSEYNKGIFSYQIALDLIHQAMRELGYSEGFIQKMDRIGKFLPEAFPNRETDIYWILKRLPYQLTVSELRARLGSDKIEALLLDNFGRGPRPAEGELIELRGTALWGMAESARALWFARLLKEANQFYLAGDRGAFEARIRAAGQLMFIGHDGDRQKTWDMGTGEIRDFRVAVTDAYLDGLIADRKSGDLLRQARASLEYQPGDYKASRPELDLIVDVAKTVPGVVGASLTGKGLGGNVVILVKEEAVESLRMRLSRDYFERVLPQLSHEERARSIAVNVPVGGAQLVRLEPSLQRTIPTRFEYDLGGEILLKFIRRDAAPGIGASEIYDLVYRGGSAQEQVFGNVTIKISEDGIRVPFLHLSRGQVPVDELRRRAVFLLNALSQEAGRWGGALIVDDQDFIRNWGMGRILREQYPTRVDFSPEEHGFLLRPPETAEGVRVNWGALPANFQTAAEGIFTNLQQEDLTGQLHAALALSERGDWNPDLNKIAETLTETNPADYLARRPKAASRRYNRSGWVTMPDRILTIAEAQVERDVARMEEAIRQAHPDLEGEPIRYVIWAGMGGSAEIGKTINSPEILKFATKDRKIFILDSTDKEAVKGILIQMIQREEAIRRASGTLPAQTGKAYYEALLREALKRTVVLGVSMGMTSEEPVINLTAIEKIFSDMLGMSADQVGGHFWGMTLENSTVHEFLKVKGWGGHRLAIQLDGEARSTLSGRNSYNSRVALLHLGFLGIPIKSYLAAQSAPHFTDKDRWQAFRLSAALAAAEAAGFSQPTLLLPDSLQPGTYWLMQQTEESLGKNGAHLLKMDVPHRLSWELIRPVGNVGQRRAFIHVTFTGEDDPHREDVERLKQEGYWVIEVNLPKAEGALGALPTFLHYWTHVVLGLGYHWGNDTVGQYYVELYKKYVQLFILEAMGRGGFGGYSFENVNTPEVTEAKQRWLKRPDPQVGSLKDTKPWKDLMASSHKAEFEGVTLYFDGILGEAPRYYKEHLGWALQSIGVSSLERANAAEIYAALMLLARRDEAASFTELTYYGDMVHTEHGQLLKAYLEGFAQEVMGEFVGLLSHVVEGPRDNHSRLEMSTAGKNEGIITLMTRSLLPIKAGYPMPTSDENSLDGYLDRIIASYPLDYLPMQTLATYQSYLDHNRRVVLIEGDITSEWLVKFHEEVKRLLSIAQAQRSEEEVNAAL